MGLLRAMCLQLQHSSKCRVVQGADRDVPRADGRAHGGGGQQDRPAQPRHGAGQVQTRRRQQGGAQGPHTVDYLTTGKYVISSAPEMYSLM